MVGLRSRLPAQRDPQGGPGVSPSTPGNTDPRPSRRDTDELFAEALELEPEERSSFLIRACKGEPDRLSRLQDLLAAHDSADDFLSTPAVSPEGRPSTPYSLDGEQALPPSGAAVGDRIDDYRLVERLGEGGFGIVFRAEQTHPVRREVALKILKLGMDTREVVARFQRERQALASTEHPNVARILDAGATEIGRPYFVMELVRGIDICSHADRSRLGIEERLELFEQVCRGVHHAHKQGIVHRDLKPRNVLISVQDGVATPKVIDFGVAKATRTSSGRTTLATRVGSTVGTPAYMSPEQASLDETSIDERTDVYTLGVLLHELLLGRTPHNAERLESAPPAEVARILTEEPIMRPSLRAKRSGDRARERSLTPTGLSSALRGDLDWILLRALEVERDRRYPTAAAIADDVRRQLDGKPVHARPPSQAYRIRRFVRRHRTAALGAAATFIALVLGAFIASKEYRRAQDEARIATARSAFVQDLLAGSIPGAELATRARLAFGADHAAVAEALGVAAARAREEGELSSAIQLLEESVRAWQALYPGGHIRVARAHGRLADALHVQGDLQSAEAQYRLAMAAAGVDSPLVLEREGLARILRNRGEAEEAGSLLAEAVEMRRLHYPEQRESLAATLNSLSEVLRRLGLNERSAQVYREMITESRGAFPAESLVHAEQQLAFGVTLRSLGQRVEAEGHLRSGLAQFEDSGFPRGASYLAGLLALAGVLEDEADPGTQREIDMLLLNAEQITRRLHGPDSLQLANLLERSSKRSSQRGELLEATRRQQEALEIRSRALGDSFQPTEEVGVLSRLASRIAGSAGITREAYATALEAVEFLTAQVTDPESLRVLRTRLALRLEPEVEQLRELERELNPDREKLDPERLALLALVHSQLGQPTLARNYLSHAESLTIETGRDSDRDLTQLLDEVRQAIGEF